MWKFLILVTVALLIGPSQIASADHAAPLEVLEVGLWPQYDDPRTLVILRGRLVGEPAAVELTIPAGMALNAVAEPGSDGTLLTLEARQQSEGEVTRLTFLPSAAEFQVELYATPIGAGPQREIAFTLPPQHVPVAQLRWHVVVPADAANVAAEPAFVPSGQTAEGLPRFVREAGPLPAGTPATQLVRYTRRSDVPVVAAALPAPSPGLIAPQDRWLLAVALTLFTIGAGLVAWGILGRYRRRRRRRTRCVCGAPFQPGARFCPRCGRPILLR